MAFDDRVLAVPRAEEVDVTAPKPEERDVATSAIQHIIGRRAMKAVVRHRTGQNTRHMLAQVPRGSVGELHDLDLAVVVSEIARHPDTVQSPQRDNQVRRLAGEGDHVRRDARPEAQAVRPAVFADAVVTGADVKDIDVVAVTAYQAIVTGPAVKGIITVLTIEEVDLLRAQERRGRKNLKAPGGPVGEADFLDAIALAAELVVNGDGPGAAVHVEVQGCPVSPNQDVRRRDAGLELDRVQGSIILLDAVVPVSAPVQVDVRAGTAAHQFVRLRYTVAIKIPPQQ